VKRSLLALLLFSLVLGPGAAAHDSLVGQFPAENQVLEAGLIDLALEFSADLMNIEGSDAAEIVVTGPLPEQTLQNNGCANVAGRQVTARIELTEPGTYQVGWRVVSEDGHPISGSYQFELVNTTGYEALGFEQLECDGAESELTLAEQNQDSINYLLLWISLPLIGLGLLLFLWPRKRSGEKQ
jgi:methionine-rich copper-binding protein CopC